MRLQRRDCHVRHPSRVEGLEVSGTWRIPDTRCTLRHTVASQRGKEVGSAPLWLCGSSMDAGNRATGQELMTSAPSLLKLGDSEGCTVSISIWFISFKWDSWSSAMTDGKLNTFLYPTLPVQRLLLPVSIGILREVHLQHWRPHASVWKESIQSMIVLFFCLFALPLLDPK